MKRFEIRGNAMRTLWWLPLAVLIVSVLQSPGAALLACKPSQYSLVSPASGCNNNNRKASISGARYVGGTTALKSAWVEEQVL